MALAAAQCIDRIAELLVAASTAAGVRVWTDRAWPVDETELPSIQVFAADEEINPQTVHWPPLQEHRLRVLVVGKCRAAAGIDDTFNTLALEIQQALFGTLAAATLAPLSGVQMQHVATERVMAEEGQAVLASVTVHLRVTYHTNANDPETFA